jgi:hypothetical protein
LRRALGGRVNRQANGPILDRGGLEARRALQIFTAARTEALLAPDAEGGQETGLVHATHALRRRLPASDGSSRKD